MATYSIQSDSIFEVRYLNEYQDQTIMSVLHYAIATPFSPIPDGPTFVQAVANEFASLAAGKLLPVYQSAVVDTFNFNSVEAQLIAPVRWAKRSANTLVSGIIGAQGMPSNSSADITRRADRVRNKADGQHRGGVSTFHLGGIPVTAVDQNFITQLYRTTELTALAGALLATRLVAGATLYPVLWHRRASVAPFADQVVGATAQGYVRTMRRRGQLLGI